MKIATLDTIRNLIRNFLKRYTIIKKQIVLTSTISANTEYTIPIYYKVGDNVLDVYYMGEKLIKDTSDCEGNYQEVGDKGSISNKIKIGWNAEKGEYFEFVVRGKYVL